MAVEDNRSNILKLWNPRIMPGFAVIATDRRTPEYPENAQVERGPWRPYHTSIPLLNDRTYVRYLRLQWERLLTPIFEETSRIEGKPISFPRAFLEAVRIIPRLMADRGFDHEFETAKALSILNDYRSDPRALLNLSN